MDRTRYDALAPRAEYLSDVVVLAQAWKKSHTYIRRHNWYADTLELDCSAVELASRLDTWAAEIAGGSFQTSPLRLIPAPKNTAWSFNASTGPGWTVKDTDQEQLRPLAHLGIRDQTVATAVMLCLSDFIETAQGNTASDTLTAGAAGVYSYGNRLYCRWQDREAGREVARFSWGNSDTYSRYFRDYQQFIERPHTVAQKVREFYPDRSLFVLKLDLSSFYDNVDIDLLVRCLRDEWIANKDVHEESTDDAGFWDLAKKALTFHWHEDDARLQHLLKEHTLPKGLPQGMVSSGFFANAYLLKFDRSIGALSLHTDHEQNGCVFRLHDYCRYVDDLRLVISVPYTETPEKRFAPAVTAFVQTVLDLALADASTHLRINPEKTEMEPLSDVGGESGTAARMKALQQQLSGPFDMGMLQQTEAGLDGLLAQAELSLHDRRDTQQREHSLALIARSRLEVRDDTLTRFAAYRWVRALRLRRRMTSASTRSGRTSPILLLKHDFEMVARKLVAAWAVNPSLVQVLRYALDLFPSPELLRPIVSALRSHIVAVTTDYQRHVALYVVAELLRAGATETGLRALRDAEFGIGDVHQYRRELQTLAIELLTLHVPWYVLQQASLFLATVGFASTQLKDGPELARYLALHKFLVCDADSTLNGNDLISVSLVGYQLQNDVSRYRAWFRKFAKKRPGSEISVALEIVGNSYPELLATISRPRPTRAATGALPAHLGAYMKATRQVDGRPLANSRWLPFSAAIMHPSRYFDQENALLKLCRGLSLLVEKTRSPPEALTPWSLDLWCDSWHRVNEPDGAPIAVKVRSRPGFVDRRYATPGWCSEQDAWMYAIGRLLRAAATGEPDFTVRQWLVRDNVGWYSGLRSTWHQRRVGMLQTHSALRGTQAGITPWFTQLLMRLLRWPGIFTEEPESVGLADIRTPAELTEIVEKRIAAQGTVFGASSRLPVYLYPVHWPIKQSRNLRVAVLQGLMPLMGDFDSGLSSLSKPGYREKHRDHVATLLNLAHKNIAAREAISGESTKPKVDLVVLPEYCIHVDDQDLARAFSDATGAMMFYGLLGARDPVTGADINAARWLVPQRRGGRRSWIEIDQGKQHPTQNERKIGIQSWRPYQVIIELRSNAEPGFRMSGAVCYDATDLALAADLKNVSHMFVVAAMNRDVKTFDSMIGALRYHMYQHVIIANSGEHGGSTAQAPYDKEYKRLVTHSHGPGQLSIAIFDVNVDHFGPQLVALTSSDDEVKGKTPPADLRRATP